MSKYEQLIEFIINEQEDKARELFHQIVVEKSREIYESIIDEEDLEEIGGNPVEKMVDEITGDETGMSEEEDMDVEMDDEEGDEELDVELDSDEDGMDMDMDADMEPDMDMDAEMDMDDTEGEMDAPATKQDLKDFEDEITAKFEQLLAQEMGADEGMADEMPVDMMETSDDDEEDDEEDDDEEDLQEAKAAKKEEMLAKKDAKKDGKRKMTEAEWLREYVDQIGDVYSQQPAQGEGHEVGHGKKAKVDTSSPTGPGVDMGGHVVKTKGTEENPDNKPVPEPNNEYTKGKGNLPHAGKFQNVPGAKAKPQNSGKPEYSKAHGAEGQTTAGKMSVTTKSPVAKV